MKLCIFDLDDTLYDASFRLDEVTPNFAKMELFPDARAILENVSIPKVLVTHGKKELQEKKIKMLGIKKYFREIFIIGEGHEKHGVFKNILKKYKIQEPLEVVVVGDRIDTEIRFGNMLGCTTVQLLRGKYLKLEPRDSTDVPKHTIRSFKDLVPILGG